VTEPPVPPSPADEPFSGPPGPDPGVDLSKGVGSSARLPPPITTRGRGQSGKLLLALFVGVAVLCGGLGVLLLAARSDSGSGATRDDPAPMGTEVSPTGNWSITVTAADLDATDEVVGANRFNRLEPDNVMVKVTVGIRNGSERPGVPLGHLEVGLIGPAGATIAPKPGMAGVSTLSLAEEVAPGATLSGDLVFELPPADLDDAVLLAEPPPGSDARGDQRFLAIH
jgi:hypothetical protein